MSVAFALTFKVEFKGGGEGAWEGGNRKRKFWIAEILRDGKTVKAMWTIQTNKDL